LARKLAAAELKSRKLKRRVPKKNWRQSLLQVAARPMAGRPDRGNYRQKGRWLNPVFISAKNDTLNMAPENLNSFNPTR